MPRKHRATSVDGQVIAMQSALSPTLQPPWPLDRKQRPVWTKSSTVGRARSGTRSICASPGRPRRYWRRCTTRSTGLLAKAA